MRRVMQSQQIPPDVSFGFGTEVEEGGGHMAGVVVLALLVAVVACFVWRWKAKKR